MRKSILQVRTDTINEIRKEVEILPKIQTSVYGGEDLREDIKTFLNKLDQKEVDKEE